MKRLLLTFLLLCSFVPSNHASASGSNTVFLPVRFGDYIVTSAIHDTSFNSSKLFNSFESAQRNTMLVSRVSAYIYRTTYYYTYFGFNVDLGFDQYETVAFTYYPSLKAILGVTKNDELVILLPQVQLKPEMSQRIIRP